MSKLLLFSGLLAPILFTLVFFYISAGWGNLAVRIVLSAFLAYAPTYPVTLYLSYKDGCISPWVQRLAGWQYIRKYFRSKIELEEELNQNSSYIFCAFPHGACSVNHLLLMTDCCGMLSRVHTGPRRDLIASVLFLIPIIKEVIIHYAQKWLS